MVRSGGASLCLLIGYFRTGSSGLGGDLDLDLDSSLAPGSGETDAGDLGSSSVSMCSLLVRRGALDRPLFSSSLSGLVVSSFDCSE